MFPYSFLRIALRLLMVVSLLAAGIVAPTKEIGGDHSAEAIADVVADAATPCDEMDMPSPPADAAPCDCCPAQACDLSACMGTACLPDLPRMAASAQLATMSVPWQQPALPAGLVDTPLRPPIA